MACSVVLFSFFSLHFKYTTALIGTMPVGGVQSQNPTQGLVHWMSAVMAEHMTSNSHHDPTVGMHYMWNGGVDVSIDQNIFTNFYLKECQQPKQ